MNYKLKQTEVLVPETQLSQILFLYIEIKLHLGKFVTIYSPCQAD